MRPTPDELQQDPLKRLELNERSARQAWMYLVAVPALTLGAALIILVVSRASGGPACDSGDASWLCTRTAEVLFAAVPGTIATAGMFGAAWITYAKWKNYIRWRPWIGVVWFLMPFALMWVTSTGAMLLSGS